MASPRLEDRLSSLLFLNSAPLRPCVSAQLGGPGLCVSRPKILGRC